MSSAKHGARHTPDTQSKYLLNKYKGKYTYCTWGHMGWVRCLPHSTNERLKGEVASRQPFTAAMARSSGHVLTSISSSPNCAGDRGKKGRILENLKLNGKEEDA